jgi:uncharacterized membrane protein
MAGLARQVMRSTKTLTLIAIFTSLIIASDYALAPIYNVKLMDTLVFSAAYSFGLRIAASIAILSESIWSVVNPTGFYLPIIPFLLVGELLFVLAGYFASKIWKIQDFSGLSSRNLFFGAILAICAFVWGVEVNVATGLLLGVRSLYQLLAYEVAAIYFDVAHEVSNFILGATLAPFVILMFRRYAPGLHTYQAAQIAPQNPQ